MSFRRFLKLLAGITVIAAVALAAFLTRQTWLPWIMPAEQSDEPAAGSVVRAPSEVQQAKLTAQAQRCAGRIHNRDRRSCSTTRLGAQASDYP